jgi:uncharacterized protein (TIGR03067 family)
MKIRCILALTVALALALGVSAQDAKQEQAKLQGKWQASKLEIEGNAIPDNELAKLKITIEGDKLIASKDGAAPENNSFKLDPSKKPRAIDVIPASGQAEGKTLQGIYELEGDTLKLCLGMPGVGRPDAFAAGEMRVFITLKRVK